MPLSVTLLCLLFFYLYLYLFCPRILFYIFWGKSFDFTLAQLSARQTAVSTSSGHGQADSLTKTDEQFVDLMPFVPWEPGLQRYPGLFGRFSLMPAPKIRDSVNMDIDANAFILSPSGTHAEICHLWTYPGKFHQFLCGRWDV